MKGLVIDLKFFTFILLLINLFVISSCNQKEIVVVSKYVDDINYQNLLMMLEEPKMDNVELRYNVCIDSEINIIVSECKYGAYSIKFTKFLQTFTHTLNSNTIELIEYDTSYNQTTSTFMSNVSISSLDHFSTLILDSFKDEFSYYSVLDFIPIALSLAVNEDLEFLHQRDSFNQNFYQIKGTVNNLKLDDNLHNILMNTSDYYQEIYNDEVLEISLVFTTDSNNEYFLSTFEFEINNTKITQII